MAVLFMYVNIVFVVREILSISTNMKVFFAEAVHATPTHMQVYTLCAGWLYHWN